MLVLGSRIVVALLRRSISHGLGGKGRPTTGKTALLRKTDLKANFVMVVQRDRFYVVNESLLHHIHRKSES